MWWKVKKDNFKRELVKEEQTLKEKIRFDEFSYVIPYILFDENKDYINLKDRNYVNKFDIKRYLFDYKKDFISNRQRRKEGTV